MKIKVLRVLMGAVVLNSIGLQNWLGFTIKTSRHAIAPPLWKRSFTVFSRTAAGVTLLPNAVHSARFTGAFIFVRRYSTIKTSRHATVPPRWKRSFTVFSRTAAGVTLFYPVLYIRRVLLEHSYSSADIVLSMIKILFLQKFEVCCGFVYLFAIYKQ